MYKENFNFFEDDNILLFKKNIYFINDYHGGKGNNNYILNNFTLKNYYFESDINNDTELYDKLKTCLYEKKLDFIDLDNYNIKCFLRFIKPVMNYNYNKHDYPIFILYFSETTSTNWLDLEVFNKNELRTLQKNDFNEQGFLNILKTNLNSGLIDIVIPEFNKCVYIPENTYYCDRSFRSINKITFVIECRNK